MYPLLFYLLGDTENAMAMTAKDGKPDSAPINITTTTLTIQTVIRLIVIVVAVVLGWADLKYDIKQLRSEVMHAARDRWTKTDDMVYMLNYSRMNNLLMPDHERASTAHPVTPPAKDGEHGGRSD